MRKGKIERELKIEYVEKYKTGKPELILAQGQEFIPKLFEFGLHALKLCGVSVTKLGDPERFHSKGIPLRPVT